MTTATTIKERPIIFSGPMVRAILDGRKTQTRRIVGGNAVNRDGKIANVAYDVSGPCEDDPAAWGFLTAGDHGYELVRCPYGQPGDRLWAKETWTSLAYNNLCHEADDEVVYKAQDDAEAWQDTYEGWRWRSPIHMPRWASRLLLEVTDVRVQRVQDISEEDAVAEGIDMRIPKYPHRPGDGATHPSAVFSDLWESINAKRGYAWESNPWVWAVTFSCVSA